MDILVRKKGEGKERWIIVKEQKYESEAALQNILYKSPEIIPIEKLGENLSKPRLFIKEAGLPGSGNTDLIGVDDKGNITIIECKLAANTEIRRKVIGQLLEYAAYLWQNTYDEFDAICCKAEKWTGKHLVEAMKEVTEGESETWLEEEFINNVGTNLEKGNFRLIIAVDVMNDELKRIIQFLNSRGENSPKIYALEMRQFEDTELNLQMIVPEIFGFTPLPPPGEAMNEQKFIQTGGEISRQIYFRLKELTQHEAFRNSGFTKRGYAFRYKPERGTLFVLYPARLEMWIRRDFTDELYDEETINQFYSILFEIPVFERKKDMKTPAVVVDEDTWKYEDVDTFLNAVEILVSHLSNVKT